VKVRLELDIADEAVAARLASSERSEDPCPQCGEADLVPFGAKHRCLSCGYLQPCCQPG
jgi:predicted RNA-binding Zn-ribbon protein involved in translation (DUF1610 family)